MNNRITNLRTQLDRKKWKKELIESDIKQDKIKLKKLNLELERSEKAKEIIHIVAKKTQEKLEIKLSTLVSLAMHSIFPNPYNLKTEFISRRGKIEADLYFEKNDTLYNPMRSVGGGAVDIASLSLRFSSWVLQTYPKTRSIMFLDEPLKWLKGKGLPEKGAEVIKEISKKLGIQIIMISHDPELIDSADNLIETYINNGITKIK